MSETDFMAFTSWLAIGKGVHAAYLDPVQIPRRTAGDVAALVAIGLRSQTCSGTSSESTTYAGWGNRGWYSVREDSI
ncbi:MAG: hypothetical protein QXQ48_06790 [Nitrososphaerota archaeon]